MKGIKFRNYLDFKCSCSLSPFETDGSPASESTSESTSSCGDRSSSASSISLNKAVSLLTESFRLAGARLVPLFSGLGFRSSALSSRGPLFGVVAVETTLMVFGSLIGSGMSSTFTQWLIVTAETATACSAEDASASPDVSSSLVCVVRLREFRVNTCNRHYHGPI